MANRRLTTQLLLLSLMSFSATAAAQPGGALGGSAPISLVPQPVLPQPTVVAERLSTMQLDVLPPAERIAGELGQLTVVNRECRQSKAPDLRRRIVDIAVQEWGFFGFNIVDQTGPAPPRSSAPRPRRRTAWFDAIESQRVAESIAGYWSITPDGAWILDRQNEYWRSPAGTGARWRDPWSAAFISWVMCEAGVAADREFRLAIAHHSYIDQAIEARDSASNAAAYHALNVGEKAIEPGDLLCSARRHGYRDLDDRRRHLGEGARTHCDIVVHVDAATDRILAIGGNVRGRVSLKLLYAPVADKNAAVPIHTRVGQGTRRVFAHLKLRDATAIQLDGLPNAPTIIQLSNDLAAKKTLETRLAISLDSDAS